MALTVMTNVASLNAQKNLARNQMSLDRSLGRLSSGLRINKAADDAAGLAISEKLKSQIRSMAQAERNANDGVSLLQTAEGAMSELSDLLTRMRELAVQSANDTLGSIERGFLNDEVVQLQQEVDRIAEVTEFNGITLLDGNVSALNFQVGIGDTSNDAILIGIQDMHVSAIGLQTSGSTTSLGSIDISTLEGAKAALNVIDQAVKDTAAGRAEIGAVQNRLQVTMSNLSTARENLSAANSRIRDVDVAAETSSLTRANILMQAGVSVLAQANQAPSLALSLLQ